MSGSRVAFSSADLCTDRQSAQLDADLAVAAVSLSVRRIVTQAVLRSDLCGDAFESVPRISEISRRENLAAGSLCNGIHFHVRDLIKFLTDRETFEITELAKITGLFQIRSGTETFIVTANLSRRKPCRTFAGSE